MAADITNGLRFTEKIMQSLRTSGIAVDLVGQELFSKLLLSDCCFVMLIVTLALCFFVMQSLVAGMGRRIGQERMDQW